jgi:deoxyribonuclease V
MCVVPDTDMKIKPFKLHPWDVTPREAIAIQEMLRARIKLCDTCRKINVVAGADVSFDDDWGYGGVISYTFPGLEEIERRSVRMKLTFPYIPGLLAFREAPVLLAAIALLSTEPDLLLFDGQGIAHGRRMGIATHMGIVLNKPTIGCAKSRLVGTFIEPGEGRGCYKPLVHAGETVGAVVRTRKGVKPIFVSPGTGISLSTSIKIVLQCLDGYRIPKPTREADHYVGSIKRKRIG